MTLHKDRNIIRIISILVLLSLLLIVNCERKNNENDLDTETQTNKSKSLMPRGFDGLKFGMNGNEVNEELKAHSIELVKGTNHNWEIIIFIQNTAEDKAVSQKMSSFVLSDRFSPSNPISRLLNRIKVSRVNMKEGSSYGIINDDWSPIELYFYNNKLFGISASVFNEEYKNALIDKYDEGRQVQTDKFNTIYEDDYTYMKINVADNFYLYDKDLYQQVISYVEAKLKSLDTPE
ncbi:MAG: hypothetical protein ACOCV8_06100 [Spirochaetota bacterium]